MLADGTYDAIVIDATRVDDANDASRAYIAIDLAITNGARKGDVVAVRATGADLDAIEVLGLPVTLIVEHGASRIEFE